MSDIEDVVREAMRAHDTQAPTTADFRFRAPGSRRASPWLAVAAAAVCVLVVATVVLLVSNRGSHHTAAPVAKDASPARVAKHPSRPVLPIRSCPAEMPARTAGTSDYWIPQPPKGIDAAKGFVPLDTPTHALVCAYLHGNHGKLTGTRTLDGDLSTIPAGLAWLPPVSQPDKQPCAAYAAITDGDYYLMALSYPGGTMWVAIPGQHCDGASNGPFIARNLRAEADTAYRGGHWKPLPPDTEGCPHGDGRLGQQDRFVPDRPVSLQLCREGKSPRTVTAKQDDLARLTAELNRLPTRPWGYEYQCGPAGQPSHGYVLTFGYQVGAPVAVEIEEGCHPEIENFSLQADSAGEVLTLVKRLLGP
jgi:hypothetical protein